MAPLKRILLAEDNERDLELTMAALEEHHLANEVVVARDGAEALDYLYNRGKFAGHANGFPVVVMLDLKMPKIDGLEVLRRIKADARTRDIPVVVLTCPDGLSGREGLTLLKNYDGTGNLSHKDVAT